MKSRPLQPGEALALSIAFHAALLVLFTVHAVRTAAVQPPVPKPQRPLTFQFTNLPKEDPIVPPLEEAPLSDFDRKARGGEPSVEPPKNAQPRMEGNVTQLVIPERVPKPPVQPRPEPKPPIKSQPRPQPEAPGRAPIPEARPEKPSPEDKRRQLLAKLAELETGDLYHERFDNPEGSFFDAPDADISFEAAGVDWGPYAARLHRIVKRNWMIPPAAQIGTKGVVRVRFEIGRDGSIHNLEIVDDSGVVALDDAAWAAIHNSHPLPAPPLPDSWPKDTVGVRWAFYYNTRPR